LQSDTDYEHQSQEAKDWGFNVTESVSANLDDVTLHELYLWPFADGVRAGATSVMCSYNQVNGSQSCQNSYILNHVLKNELGFQGFVVSDWYGTHSGVSAILAGLDMSMPGDPVQEFGNHGGAMFGANLTIGVLNGTVPQWRLDDACVRILAAHYYVGRDKSNVSVSFNSYSLDTYGYAHNAVGQGYGLINEHVDVRGNHAQLIRNLGSASTVLLKNVNNALPLTGKEKFTAVIGEDAFGNVNGPNGFADRAGDSGTLGMAWGSGSSNFPYLVTPDSAIENEVVNKNGGQYQSLRNNSNLDQAFSLAKQAEVALVFVNSDSGEGYLQVDKNFGDRNNLTFWQDADAMLANVSATCNNTVLVIHSVGPVLLEDYANNPNITAILWAGVPGEQSGNSIADILYGRVNPSAKLPFTMAAKRGDYGTDVLYTPNNQIPQTNFKEGIFIDYRAFDKQEIEPVYEFGFGLSYSNFSYSDIEVTKLNTSSYVPNTGMSPSAKTYGNISMNPADHLFPANFSRVSLYLYPWLNSTNLTSAAGPAPYGDVSFVPEGAVDSSPQPRLPASGGPGGNPALWDVIYRVTAQIKNVGKVGGAEVPQLYVSLGGPYDAVKMLRGFERLSIQPNQTVTFSADIMRRDIMNWSPEAQDWFVSNYTKNVYVGSSSRNLPLTAKLV
jgi:hypothetical protein